MATTKYSRQREAIIEYLSKTKEHPTADTIYMDIRETYPNISLGTVYRNLNLLVEKGEVLRLIGMDESDRYDGNTHNHYHFLCNNCKRVLDIEMESIDQINAIANKSFPGKVEGHVTYFYGTCDKCKQQI
ncbi:MAG: transcriptional repressor [Clostridiales bacterium]|jgi:Fur family peroxide stress response transcriptional regulator|nr:transcriptional repressor [Clostridiales bacterium]